MPIGSSYTATKDLVPHTCMCRCRMMIRRTGNLPPIYVCLAGFGIQRPRCGYIYTPL
jgi:hypothetical protein